MQDSIAERFIGARIGKRYCVTRRVVQTGKSNQLIKYEVEDLATGNTRFMRSPELLALAREARKNNEPILMGTEQDSEALCGSQKAASPLQG